MIFPRRIVSLVFCVYQLSLAQTTSINKVDNSGACSFTAVNVTNSTFKVTCGGKPLQPGEVIQLSRILSLMRKEDLKFDQVLNALGKLAAEPKQPTVNQNCAVDTGFCNQAPSFAPQIINDNRQYGAQKPPPALVVRPPKYFSPNQVINKAPDNTDQEYELQLSLQRELKSEDHGDVFPAAMVDVSPTQMFQDPGFLVHCDIPCKPAHMIVGGGEVSGIFSGNRMLSSPDDSHWAAFVLGSTRQLFPSDIVTLVVKSLDQRPISKIEVTGYRLP